MNRLTIFLALLIALFLTSCQDNENPINADLFWEQTACADPWGTNSNSTEAEIKEAIEEYFVAQKLFGARFVAIETVSSGPFCESCGCPSGKRIYVSAPLAEQEKLIQLGFIKL